MSKLSRAIEEAARWIADAEHHVVFTGAGLSTDSGLPDYRGPDGVWTRRDKGLPPPAMRVHPDAVRPNPSHEALVALQGLDRLAFLISQNVDGLHLDSGTDPNRIAELHGNKNLMVCTACGEVTTRDAVDWNRGRWGNGYRTDSPRQGQPACPACAGRLISTIVNFGDPMPERELESSFLHSRQADVFFAIGSSLTVSPANEMPRVAVASGARLILLNLGATPFDRDADLLIAAPIGEVLPAVAVRVGALLGR